MGASTANALAELLDAVRNDSGLDNVRMDQGEPDSEYIRQMADSMYAQAGGDERMDQDGAIFFARELEQIERTVLMVTYPEYKGRAHFPLDLTGGPAVMTKTARMFDRIGRAKVGYDFPRVDIGGKEFSVTVKPLTDSYGYGFQEIRQAAAVNMPLDSMKATAARQAMTAEENELIYFGSEEHQIMGAFTHPNIPMQNAEFDPSSLGTTPQQVQRVFTKGINSLANLTGQMMRANSVLMSPTLYNALEARPYSSTGDTTHTIMDVLEAKAGVDFDWCHECNSASPLGRDILYIYKRDPQCHQVWIPHDFESFPPRVNMQEETQINCHQRFGGSFFRRMNALIIQLPTSTPRFQGSN